MDALELPFRFIRVPSFKLRLPWNWLQPSPMVVFGFVFLTYFIFLSGVIYDVITETPSVGSHRDEATGSTKPVAIMAGRVNGQFIIEGLSAGFMFCLGGLGLIVLDRSAQKHITNTNRYLMLLAGCLFLVVSYNVCQLFIRIKVPGYMR